MTASSYDFRNREKIEISEHMEYVTASYSRGIFSLTKWMKRVREQILLGTLESIIPILFLEFFLPPF